MRSISFNTDIVLFKDLSENLVRPGVTASSMDEIIEVLLDILEETGRLQDRSLAVKDIANNRAQTSFGMQHGIAIPHARTLAVDDLAACIATTTDGIDCSSVDGKPSRIFIMVLSPPAQLGMHVRFLSEIGGIMKHRRVRNDLLQAGTPEEMLSILLKKFD
jgi:mannitol/fructose-specific phosphotransferase system IIA component (Ntr-type)